VSLRTASFLFWFVHLMRFAALTTSYDSDWPEACIVLDECGE
jgi:hypothetical protein